MVSKIKCQGWQYGRIFFKFFDLLMTPREEYIWDVNNSRSAGQNQNSYYSNYVFGN
jgi:hypothetical protein